MTINLFQKAAAISSQDSTAERAFRFQQNGHHVVIVEEENWSQDCNGNLPARMYSSDLKLLSNVNTRVAFGATHRTVDEVLDAGR